MILPNELHSYRSPLVCRQRVLNLFAVRHAKLPDPAMAVWCFASPWLFATTQS